MTKQFCKVLLLTIAITLLGCGWDCSFTTIGNCLVTNSNQSFRLITIDVDGKRYLVHCGIDKRGTNKMCLDDIPSAYTVTTGGKDTIFPARIELFEGNTVIIDNSGGDRKCAAKKFIVKNTQLIEQH